MAKRKYVVAVVLNKVGDKGEMGIVLGEFRKSEFATRAKDRMLKEAAKRNHREIGLFLNGKFLGPL